MAITHIGNIAHINQNTLLNSQLQAAQQNAQNTQNLVNIQEFTQKMQENLEVRKAEESRAIDKDGQNQGGRENAKKHADSANIYTKERKNRYGEGGVLDVEV